MNSPDDPCSSPSEFLRALNRKVARERIPIAGSYDLTHRCNLRCVHCYCGPAAACSEVQQHELTTRQATSVIDQAAEAGCLFFLISGGEPLLRPDFADIYLHARQRGLLVTLFTNGTLMDDRTADVLAEWPPRAVEITLYGATPETQDRITGTTGSFEQCWKGIRLLRDRGVPVRLKTILMTLNSREYGDMEKLALSNGFSFRSDPAIFPRFDGDRSPLALRVPPAEAVRRELARPEAARKWKTYHDRVAALPPSDRLYGCGAGVTSFYIDPYGMLQPCLMTRNLQYDLLGGSFAEGWRDVLSRIAEKRGSPGRRCQTCAKRALCGYCPAFFLAENGDEGIRSSYLCELGEHRHEQLVGR